jgi:hypothetical protein
VDELASVAGGDERDGARTGHRMGDHTGVHDRRVRRLIGAAGDDHAEAVVEGHERLEGGEVGHVSSRWARPRS